MTRFLAVIFAFLSYTCVKAIQLWPSHVVAAVASSIAVFAVMLGGTFVYRADNTVFEKGWFHALAWVGSLVMATWATFIFLSLPFDAVHLVIAVFQAPTEFFRVINGYVLVASIVFVSIGFAQVLRGPLLKPVAVSVAGLPAELSGFRIAHFSDLHVGPTLRKGYVQSVVRRINAANADIVVFTGDMADARVSSIAEHLQPLAELKAARGSFYITGNHEYYWNAAEVISKMKQLGFTALLNDNAILDVGSSKVMVAGVTDPAGESLPGHTPDASRARQSTASTHLKILLAHRPGVADEAERLGFDLQLSGHTHAGQFFPFNLVIGLFHRYTRGLYRQGKLAVYVNPGTGYWGPADRLGVAPEISLITLTTA